mmetsp:Transcript_18564/g.55047  ORF Transcript_18564/g.55047 Transcript_18564/m.55047 type:complete len:224 (+) Transcript_18564:201-872(+)
MCPSVSVSTLPRIEADATLVQCFNRGVTMRRSRRSTRLSLKPSGAPPARSIWLSTLGPRRNLRRSAPPAPRGWRPPPPPTLQWARQQNRPQSRSWRRRAPMTRTVRLTATDLTPRLHSPRCRTPTMPGSQTRSTLRRSCWPMRTATMAVQSMKPTSSLVLTVWRLPRHHRTPSRVGLPSRNLLRVSLGRKVADGKPGQPRLRHPPRLLLHPRKVDLHFQQSPS